MTVGTFKKPLAVALAFLMGSVHGVFVYSGESNFWAERRKEVKRSAGSALLLASLPLVGMENPIPSSGVSDPLSGPVRKGLPSDFLQKNKALFAALSREFGTIRKISMGAPASPRGPVVVHIQDVHMNADAQRNIGAVVKKVLTEVRVNLLALEGTWGEVNLTPLRDFQYPWAVQQAADTLLKDNQISGAIQGALTGRGPLPLIVGIDDPTHYSANVAAYRHSAPRVDAYQEILRGQAERLDQRKGEVYSKTLWEFDRQVQKYRQGEMSLGNYTLMLLSRRPSGVSPSIRAMTKALEIERDLDFRQVELERAHLIERLVPRLTPKQEDQLLSLSLAYRSERLSYGEFYSFLSNLCRDTGLTLSAFPSLDRYVHYVLLSDQIEGGTLSQNLESLEKDLYGELARTPEERRLVAESREIWLTQKLVAFAMTPDDWASYQAARRSLFPSSLGDPAKGLDLRSFESFYESAQRRDRHMARNLQNVLGKNSGVALLVTGGYHAEGITHRLTAAGITVISFVPRIEKVDTTEGSKYLSVFTQEKSPLEKLFQGDKLYLAKNPVEPSVLKMLLPGLVVFCALWGGGFGTNVDPNIFYAGLGGVGVLSGLRIFQNRGQFRIARDFGRVDVWVEIGKKGIERVQDQFAVGREASFWKKGSEYFFGVRGWVKNHNFPLINGFYSPELRRLLVGVPQVFVFGAIFGWIVYFGMATYSVDFRVWEAVLWVPLMVERGSVSQINMRRPPEMAVGKNMDLKKLNALYNDLIDLDTRLRDGRTLGIQEERGLVVKANRRIEFDRAVGEIIRKSGELSPEFKAIFEDSSPIGPGELPELYETLSRYIFIPAGRCLPRNFRSFKTPLVINPSSWKLMSYLGDPIWVARVSPYGLRSSRLDALSVVAPRGYVFVNDLIHEKAKKTFKTIQVKIRNSRGKILSQRLSNSKITERDIDGVINDWALRLELSKTKNAMYTAKLNEMGMAEVTSPEILSAILRPGGPAQQNLMATLRLEKGSENGTLAEDPFPIHLSYAEYLDSFYDHLLPLQEGPPDKAYVLGALTLAEILTDSLESFPRGLGARLLVDQIREKVGLTGPGPLYEVTKIFSEKFSLFEVIEKIRRENLILPEERFFHLNQRAPTQRELDQLDPVRSVASSPEGGTRPLVAATKRSRSLISTSAVRLLQRFDLSERALPQEPYGPEVKEIVKRFKTLSDQFSDLENPVVSQEMFTAFLEELTGGDLPAKGFRYQAGQRQTIDIVQTCATLLEDLLREMGTRVFDQSIKKGQTFLEQGDFQGAIRLFLDLKGQGPLLDTLPQEAMNNLERLLESARYLFLHDSRQPALPLSEIVAKADLFGLDEEEVNFLQTQQNHSEFDERKRGDEENLIPKNPLTDDVRPQEQDKSVRLSVDGRPVPTGESRLNAWGLALLCGRLGKHVPAALEILKTEMQEKEAGQKTGDFDAAWPLTLRGGYRVFLSDAVNKSNLWTQHQREILLKLDKFLADSLDGQMREKKEKLDVTMGGLLLGSDLPHIHRDYLPAARFYFRVFDETVAEGENRRALYLIAVENKGDSSEKGGRGKINEQLKQRLRKVSLAAGSGNMSVFGKFNPLLQGDLAGKVSAFVSGGVAMHQVGGRRLNGFQFGFLEKRAKTKATVEIRRAWAAQIEENLINPVYRDYLRPLRLILPVMRLVDLLRSENPTVTIGGRKRPIQFKLFSGSPEDFFPGMPRAFGTIKGEGGSRGIEMGVFPDDLAAVLHEGLEIVLREDPFSNVFAENAHTYAFLGEVLGNRKTDIILVSKRALIELGRKNLGELIVFLRNGYRNLFEINRKFKQVFQEPVRKRSIENNQILTHYALTMVRERSENTSTLFYGKVREVERWMAMGSMEEAGRGIEDLQRLLYHLERERGPLPLLAKYVERLDVNQRRLHSLFGETESQIAPSVSKYFGELETIYHEKEYESLMAGIKMMREVRMSLPPFYNQLPLFDLWEKMGDVFTPLFEAGDWIEADKRFESFVEFGITLVKTNGINGSYVEGLFYDFLGFYRTQRDWAHRNKTAMKEFSQTVQLLNEFVLKTKVSDADRKKVIRTLYERIFQLTGFELEIIIEILSHLNPNLNFPLLHHLAKPHSSEVSKRHSPLLARILSKYPSLPVSPDEISRTFSMAVSHDLTGRQAVGRMEGWGVARTDAQLYLMDVNELNLEYQFKKNFQAGQSSVKILAGMAGVLSMGFLLPFFIGKDTLGVGVVGGIVSSIGGVWTLSLGLSLLLGLGFVGVVGWGFDYPKKFSWPHFSAHKVRTFLFNPLSTVAPSQPWNPGYSLRRVSPSQEKKLEVVRGILSLLQEQPIPLGVEGKSLIETASGFGEDRAFLDSLHEHLRQGEGALSFAQARRRLISGFRVGGRRTSAGRSLPVGDGEKPLTIVYLDEGMVTAEKSLSSIIDQYSSGERSEIVLVPVDKKAWEATRGLAQNRGIWIVGHIISGVDADVSTGRWYRLANVEQRLSALGVQLSEYTGCRIVAPLRLDIGMEGIKSDLFRSALVILLDGLTPLILRNTDLYHIDRVARAVTSAA